MWKGGKIPYLRQKHGIEFSVDNKTLLNAATTILPLSFSESITAFSKQGRDAVASELRGMDAAYERCVKKAVIYSD